MDTTALRNEVATAISESDAIEFKSRLDTQNELEWAEVVKDVVAIHNSSGGVIVFGLNSDGSRSDDGGGIQGRLDAAQIIDKVTRYTGATIHGLLVDDFGKGGHTYRGWVIPPAAVPVPFTTAGPQRSEKAGNRAFHAGQVYVRHGAKSEPARYQDMVA